jgi:purine-binding chemotaxis protein CheW
MKQATDPRNNASAARRDDTVQYLTFLLGGESFGIGIMAVKEIIEYGGVTDVPMMPESIRGVINLRGAVVPVMDLAARFGRPPAVPGKRTCIVIVELETHGEHQVMGVVVDAVSAVLDIPSSDIEPAPSFGTRIRGDFIAGMGKVNGKFVILLDVDEVLALDGLPELAVASDVGV